MFKKFQLTPFYNYLSCLSFAKKRMEKKFNYLGSLIVIKRETIVFARYFLNSLFVFSSSVVCY